MRASALETARGEHRSSHVSASPTLRLSNSDSVPGPRSRQRKSFTAKACCVARQAAVLPEGQTVSESFKGGCRVLALQNAQPSPSCQGGYEGNRPFDSPKRRKWMVQQRQDSGIAVACNVDSNPVGLVRPPTDRRAYQCTTGAPLH